MVVIRTCETQPHSDISITLKEEVMVEDEREEEEDEGYGGRGGDEALWSNSLLTFSITVADSVPAMLVA